MNIILIICGSILLLIGLTVLFFFIKIRIAKKNSGHRIVGHMCFEDEYADGLDFTYKKTRRKG